MSSAARLYVLLWLLVSSLAIPVASLGAASQSPGKKTTQNSPKSRRVVYTNKEFRFRLSLPESWSGYSVRISRSKGGDALISIRHPLSTDSNPWQDIPIMIFTKARWKLVEEGKLIVSAAPVGPSELGRNAEYVFALPPRSTTPMCPAGRK